MAADPAASSSRPSGLLFPDWVLLDTVGRHMTRRREDAAATAAVSATSTGVPIEISFAVAAPPALTRCFVHCPELTPADFLQMPPCITGADGAFLLRVILLPSPAQRPVLILRPYPTDLTSNHVGVLHVSGEHCIIIVLRGRTLHIFSTETMSWSTKAARDTAARHVPFKFRPGKVLAVDGGRSLAWVDLRRGILLCDSVAGDDDDPELRMIRVPPLTPINSVEFGVDSDGMTPPLDGIRDVAYRDGFFRVIELGFPELDAGGNTGRYDFKWTTSVFKSKVGSENWEVETCRSVDSTKLLLDRSCLRCLIPEIWEEREKRLVMNNVISIFPTLDPHRDDVFYMVTRMQGLDLNGWVTAVNADSKKLEKIEPFSVEWIRCSRTILQCAFSKHFKQGPR
ncbi:unnamed protein product [Urochloa decumbens]|uniref:DUF1618 domain-containing protein n=1 Tax=Urochloa decumbens TaxID=240449 RepID=A0ABC8VWM6_9POAL